MSIRTRFHLTFGIRYSVLRRFEYAVFECSKHYANTPMQYTSIFYWCENDNFQVKNHIFLFFFLQTFVKGTYKKHLIEAFLMSIHNLCFTVKIRKMYTHVHPRFTIFKWGLRGYTSHGHVILMEGNDSTSEV